MHIYSIAIKRQKKGPMQPVRNATITEQDGIVGDCRGSSGLFRKRQVTVISLNQWEEACREIGKRLPTFSRRANLCITGHVFGPGDVGRRIFIGRVILEITGETKPCHRMDEVAPGLRKALEPDWRGGVTCRVIQGGDINQDQGVYIIS